MNICFWFWFQDKLKLIEQDNQDAMFVIISDIWLDQPQVLLKTVLISLDCLHQLPYRTKIRWTEISVWLNFRHIFKFSSILSNFCLICINILDKIFVEQKFSSYKIFVSQPNFPKSCPTNSYPISWLLIDVCKTSFLSILGLLDL